MKPVSIGLLGLGTVGQGVARILTRNAAEIERRTGCGIRVTLAAVRDRNKAEALNLGIGITTDAQALVSDPSIDIVCEAIGGEDPTLALLHSAIANGKHVVTANKALIAIHGNELFRAAHTHGVTVAFESAVAGGIPIIKALREGLAANRIQWLAGIINGTGNFILSEMAEKGRRFDDVLAEAQALGYAEADPTFDVEGIDAAHKLAIMASVAFGMPLRFDAVYTEGISKVTREDVEFADELGYRIKHLGVARRRKDGVELRVHPTLIPERRLLANVNGVMNAVVVYGDAVGPTLYYGAGAGSEPTGSAMVADIIDIVRALDADPSHRVPILGFQDDALKEHVMLKTADYQAAYYLRLHALDQPGVLATVTDIFGKLGISIEAILQKEPEMAIAGELTEDSIEVPIVPIILLTRRVREGLIEQAIERIQALSTITQPVTRIRVESL
ncbi:MAG: homoserine dehydrogenase [Granulosicoccus sp.]|nr:homoserine dehydrogenase [Granulosicoccus sp.]